MYGVCCTEIQKNCPERKQMASGSEQFIYPEHFVNEVKGHADKAYRGKYSQIDMVGSKQKRK